MTLFIEEVYMNEAIRATVSIGKGLVKNKPIELIEEINPDLLHILGDKRRIRQVFLNLVSNAVKFTTEGSVTIVSRHKQDSHEIHVAVKGTGIGIAEEDLDGVFTPFRQAQHSIDNFQGTGLRSSDHKTLCRSAWWKNVG